MKNKNILVFGLVIGFAFTSIFVFLYWDPTRPEVILDERDVPDYEVIPDEEIDSDEVVIIIPCEEIIFIEEHNKNKRKKER